MSSRQNYQTLEQCRVSGNTNLVKVLSLGNQALTGVFPKSPDEEVTSGPLDLVWCPDSGLLQLGHSFNPSEMYGENYGYRSGLNNSMVQHLTRKVQRLELEANLRPGDVVLDIGSNDATSLKAYTCSGLRRIGIDPTGEKFREHYPDDIKLVTDFFTAKNFWSVSAGPAKIVTSIAMFYDLDDPIGFAREVAEVLAEDGIWHLEQSYMPSMLRMCSYDTICHEHLEYYSLAVLRDILAEAGLKIIDVQMNAVNGGSFAVTAVKKQSTRPANDPVVNWLLEQESRMGLETPQPYRAFEERVYRHRRDLIRLLDALADDRKTVLGYGASTKGNVVLQFCNISAKQITAIAEVNPDKFGAFTPGTGIPIVSEVEARAMHPDAHVLQRGEHANRIVIAEDAVEGTLQRGAQASHAVDGGVVRPPGLRSVVASQKTDVVGKVRNEPRYFRHGLSAVLHMEVADLKHGEAVEGFRHVRRSDDIVSENDLGGVAPPAPIEPAGHQDRANDRVANRQILDVEEVDALPEDLRLVIALDAKALARMTAPEALLELLQDSVL